MAGGRLLKERAPGSSQDFWPRNYDASVWTRPSWLPANRERRRVDRFLTHGLLKGRSGTVPMRGGGICVCSIAGGAAGESRLLPVLRAGDARMLLAECPRVFTVGTLRSLGPSSSCGFSRRNVALGSGFRRSLQDAGLGLRAGSGRLRFALAPTHSRFARPAGYLSLYGDLRCRNIRRVSSCS